MCYANLHKFCLIYTKIRVKKLYVAKAQRKEFHNIGITVGKQYGTAKSMGWKYSVQLSGAYWHALEYKFNAVENILNNHTAYRISRLDLKKDVCVPLKQWRRYYSFAFKRKDYTLNGKEDARTVYLGSRQSQFFHRVYNKTADDPLNYPAPKNKVIIRAEIEIHRIKRRFSFRPCF